MRVSHGGKNGDLIYALPVIKALARTHGEKIVLHTSPLVYQLVPLLWEQPFIENVVMDYSQPYEIKDGSIIPWATLAPGEGVNLSPQPAMYRPNAPVSWTAAYAEIAGVKELTPQDKVALPTLFNHRQWYWEHDVQIEGRPPWKPPRSLVLAPESQTLRTIPLRYWISVARELEEDFDTIFVIGEKRDEPFPRVVDLRGRITVSAAARLLAEAAVAICANSLPWHIARHAGTPTFCFQDQHLERCIPIDTKFAFFTADKWKEMANAARNIAEQRLTTLWSPDELRQLGEVA